MSRARRLSVAGVVAASVALIAPAAVAAQGTDPFPDDQQPIGNEYGLPPLDHPHGSHAGGGGGGASTGGGGAGTAGATGASASAGGAASSGGALTASAVRRGEARNGANAGGGAGAGAGTSSGERLGISDVPPRASLSAGEDTRGGFDVLLIVLAGVAAAGLLLAAILSVGRPGRPAA